IPAHTKTRPSRGDRRTRIAPAASTSSGPRGGSTIAASTLRKSTRSMSNSCRRGRRANEWPAAGRWGCRLYEIGGPVKDLAGAGALGNHALPVLQELDEIPTRDRVGDAARLGERGLLRPLDEHHVHDADDLAGVGRVDRAAAVAGISGCIELE